MTSPTQTDVYLNKIKNNKPIAILTIIAIALMGISAFVSQMDNGFQVAKKTFETLFGTTKSTQTECQDCKELHLSGLKDIVNERFIEPAENNLLKKIEELKKKDIKASEDLISNASNVLHQKISESIKDNPSNARKYLAILVKIHPADSQILIYEKKLREINDRQKKTTDIAKKELASKQLAASQPQDKPTLALPSTINPSNHTPNSDKLEEKTLDNTVKSASENSIKPPNPGTSQSDELQTTSDRIIAICYAASNAYGDGSKVKILETALRTIQEITPAQVVQLFTCTDIYSDSSLVASLKLIASKKIKGRISSSDVKRILNEIYSDSSKSIAIEILTPFM